MRIPHELYLRYGSFFEQKAKYVWVETLDHQDNLAGAARVQIEPSLELTEQPFAVTAVNEGAGGAVLLAVTMTSWRHAPNELKRFVITEDEALSLKSVRSRRPNTHRLR